MKWNHGPFSKRIIQPFYKLLTSLSLLMETNRVTGNTMSWYGARIMLSRRNYNNISVN